MAASVDGDCILCTYCPEYLRGLDKKTIDGGNFWRVRESGEWSGDGKFILFEFIFAMYF